MYCAEASHLVAPALCGTRAAALGQGMGGSCCRMSTRGPRSRQRRQSPKGNALQLGSANRGLILSNNKLRSSVASSCVPPLSPRLQIAAHTVWQHVLCTLAANTAGLLDWH